MTVTITAERGHCARFRALTHDTHDKLDNRIMAFDPFASQENYTAFLRVQYAFHRDVATLFNDDQLNQLLPGLARRKRLELVARDLSDLGSGLPTFSAAPVFSEPFDLPSALGWLYVEEGSNLGGAILFKRAAKLGLDETFGARHLAAHSDGRAPSWRAFMAQVDAIELSDDEQTRADKGAEAAFSTVMGYVERFCQL
ncbi:MAG: biliverdin-producing heme oxygenase [Marinobacter sp.]